MALNFHLGEQALRLAEGGSPALDGVTPLECLKTEAGRRTTEGMPLADAVNGEDERYRK